MFISLFFTLIPDLFHHFLARFLWHFYAFLQDLVNKCFRYFSAVGCVGCPEGSNNSRLSLMSNESLGPIGLLGIVQYHCSELEVVQYECYSNEDLRDWLL